MDLEQIQKEMQNISESTTLTNEEKRARLTIYRTYIQSSINDKTYDEQMKKFIKDYHDLSVMTNNEFVIEPDVMACKIALRSSLLVSELAEYLNERGSEITYENLKYSSFDYEAETGTKIDVTRKRIDLYPQTDELVATRNMGRQILSRNLGELLGEDIISNNIELGIINKDGRAIIDLVAKSEKQLETDQNKALAKISELYTNEGILDLKTQRIASDMVTKLFGYYRDPQVTIPRDLVKQQEEAYEEPEETYENENKVM